MAKFQLLSCEVALAGDVLNVVARHAFIPVTYPEMLVLRYIHGGESITKIIDVGYVERSDAEERERLIVAYGRETIQDKMFPGIGTRLPAGDNRYRPDAGNPFIDPTGIGAIPDNHLSAASAPPAETDKQASPPTPVDYDAENGAGAYTPIEPAEDAVRAARRPVPVGNGGA